MIFNIEYMDGTVIELVSVESIRLVSRSKLLPFAYTFEIKTFGNESVMHRGLMKLKLVQLFTPESK